MVRADSVFLNSGRSRSAHLQQFFPAASSSRYVDSPNQFGTVIPMVSRTARYSERGVELAPFFFSRCINAPLQMNSGFVSKGI